MQLRARVGGAHHLLAALSSGRTLRLLQEGRRPLLPRQRAPPRARRTPRRRGPADRGALAPRAAARRASARNVDRAPPASRASLRSRLIRASRSIGRSRAPFESTLLPGAADPDVSRQAPTSLPGRANRASHMAAGGRCSKADRADVAPACPTQSAPSPPLCTAGGRRSGKNSENPLRRAGRGAFYT